ncbi:histidine phosphatase family protein [Paenibacillus lycopersici]|uniref:Histidine phosphatase family protein n=1 Tax=Paenibacillus lycopersici TaxID=2704462 RepID=A0A6C0G542_9BACL|nr:histidine phosphatase family protein [Paenibacillus lycopersici]QHT63131.1 histidine phosphatase family protein [Paenibacillus lycopersici]
MNELLLIRHGDAEHLRSGFVGGWTDTRLTDQGRRQAHCTGERLSQLLANRTVRMYGSDLSRASETAGIIGRYLAVQPILTAELRESNNGQAANLSKEEAARIGLPVTEPIIDWVPYPEAESWRMLHRRTSAFLRRIKEEPNDATVIVSHSNAIVSLIQGWLGFPAELFSVSFDIEPCSITRLRTNGWHEPTLAKLNDTSHLEHAGNF